VEIVKTLLTKLLITNSEDVLLKKLQEDVVTGKNLALSEELKSSDALFTLLDVMVLVKTVIDVLGEREDSVTLLLKKNTVVEDQNATN